MYIKVKVIPGAKKETWKKEDDTLFYATVKEKAQQNAANRRVQQLVAEHFSVEPRQVRLISGHRSQSKVFAIDSAS